MSGWTHSSESQGSCSNYDKHFSSVMPILGSS